MALSTFTYYIPGLLRPTVLKELYQAYYFSNGTQSKIERFCGIAQRLCNQGCIYSAQLPLSLGGRIAHILAEDFNKLDQIESLCKIAQVRSLACPSVLPQELTEAVDLAAQVSDIDKGRFHFLSTRIYLEMGKAYIAAGGQSEAKSHLESARKYAVREQAAEAVDALCKIASAEKQIDVGAAKATLQKAENCALDMWVGSYGKVHRLVSISDLYFSFDPDAAARVRMLAQLEVDKMVEGRETSQKLVDDALSIATIESDVQQIPTAGN